MAKKKSLVNAETDKDVYEFIEKVKPKQRKEDAKILIEVMKDITGIEPKIWGVSIIGFGKYAYQRKNGEEYEWFTVGFSPGKAHLSIYLMFDLTVEPLLKKLGPHKNGKGCLYIKKLSDVKMPILKKLIAKSKKWER